jgi:ABC-2 type transport system ATP-binding protein
MRAIHIERLTKDYRVGFLGRRKRVLRDLSLDIAAGEIFGYLGPNGAGKSTTIKLLLGLVQPTTGSAEIFGLPIGNVHARKRIGFLPENPSFYEYLTGREFLEYLGRLIGLSSAQRTDQQSRLLSEMGLASAANLQIRNYSKGMVQRLGIAQALLGSPELLILDEPMSGLDPIGRKEVRDLILRQKAQGRTVFFSSHILSDIEMICDRVGILVGGRLVKSGTITELLGEKVESIEVTATNVSEPVLKAVEVLALEPALHQEGRTMVRLAGEKELERCLSLLVSAQSRVLSVIPQRRSLEELFLSASEGDRK